MNPALLCRRLPARFYLLPWIAILAMGVPLVAQPASDQVSFDNWKTTLPFTFKYGNQDSSTTLLHWPRIEETEAAPGGQLIRIIFTDPATKLKVVAEARTYANFDAIDWVLKFSNGGSTDTPVLENIQPLDWNLTSPETSILHGARGSNAVAEDFQPVAPVIHPGQTVTFASLGGRSSSTTNLPFFNLQQGDHGVIGAIGWTGDWAASFTGDKSGHAVALRAGMKRTHLRLHPGEEIRTPRIVLLNWKGPDWQAAQNLWRRFVLAYYSPQAGGQPVVGPLCYVTWGTELIDRKFAQLKMVQDEKLPFTVYWVDAGWYGHSDGEGDEGPSPWWRNRGSWAVNPVPFPNGLKPLADAVRAAKLDFLLWMEPEEGDPETTLRRDHPEWFFLPPNANNPGTAIVNLGDPVARQGITRLTSTLITDTGMKWFRQDFNANIDRSWAAADTPDRVGMAEIKYIEGLYAMWAQLQAEHPGLLIDNCSSGGRRIDLETMSRTFALTRSDLAGPITDAVAGQMQTQGIAPWVPLNAHTSWLWLGHDAPQFDAGFIYTLRSGYSTAFGPGIGQAEGKSHEWCVSLKKLLDEYREIQPFMYGDFYPLFPYSPEHTAPVVWQWDRPDQQKGVVLAFRRAECRSAAIDLPLRGLDLQALYEVEIRLGLDHGTVQPMTGKALSHLQVTIPEQPGSAAIFYTRK